MEKLLLMDIDGCARALTIFMPENTDTTDLEFWPSYEDIQVTGTHETVAIAPEITLFLREISANVETLWFSSWSPENSDKLSAELDLDIKTVEGRSKLPHKMFWKLEWLQHNCLDREIIWVDDEALLDIEVGEWVASQNGRVKIVEVNSWTGINSQDIEVISELVSK